jgi:hypothetical protein
MSNAVLPSLRALPLNAMTFMHASFEMKKQQPL